LAREGTRFAAVRGIDSWRDTGIPSSTPTDIRDYVRSRAVGLDRDRVHVQVTYLYPSYPPAVRHLITSTGQTRINYVRVDVSYLWFPESRLFPSILLRSRSELPMSH
jgi:hypothetical protein